MSVSENLTMQPSKGLHNQVVKIVVPYCALPVQLLCMSVSMNAGGGGWGWEPQDCAGSKKN